MTVGSSSVVRGAADGSTRSIWCESPARIDTRHDGGTSTGVALRVAWVGAGSRTVVIGGPLGRLSWTAKCSASAAVISMNRRLVNGDISEVTSITPPGRRCESNGTSTTT